MRLREESLDWSLKHIEKFGDTDIFPLPFEFEEICFDWESNESRNRSLTHAHW